MQNIISKHLSTDQIEALCEQNNLDINDSQVIGTIANADDVEDALLKLAARNRAYKPFDADDLPF